MPGKPCPFPAKILLLQPHRVSPNVEIAIMKSVKANLRFYQLFVMLITSTPSVSAFYDASIGRWINRDPIAEGAGPNLYAFLGNRPVIANDPFGFMIFERACNSGERSACYAICAPRGIDSCTIREEVEAVPVGPPKVGNPLMVCVCATPRPRVPFPRRCLEWIRSLLIEWGRNPIIV
jgi:hypothetical protein